MQWQSQDVFIGRGQQPVWGGTEILLFQYRNVFYYKVLDVLVPKAQLNKINVYLTVIEIFVN